MKPSKRQEFISKFIANSPAGIGLINNHSSNVAYEEISEMMSKFPVMGNHLKSETSKEIKKLITQKEQVLQDYAVATAIVQHYILQEMQSIAYLKGKQGIKG